LGSEPYSIIVDIDASGDMEIKTDTELIAAYGGGNDDGEGNKSESRNFSSIGILPSRTKIDDKPMGLK